MMPTPDHHPKTPDELLAELLKDGRADTLIYIVDNYLAGKRVACWFVHLFIGLGVAGTAAFGIWQGIQTLILMRGHG